MKMLREQMGDFKKKFLLIVFAAAVFPFSIVSLTQAQEKPQWMPVSPFFY